MQNQSVNATSFTWDFCFQDLNTVKDVQNAATVNAAVTPTGISFFKENGNWFGFVSSRDNNKLFRLDFGISLENAPAIVDLGNVGGLLSGPQSLVFLKENNVVYGILTNYNGSNLLRLSFSSGLNAAPVVENIGGFGMSTPRGIDIIKDASNSITVAVADDINSKVVLIDFGTSILNNPTLANSFDLPMGSGTRPIGIRLMKDGNNWFGFSSLFSGNVIKRIDFGTTLSSSVTLTDIYSVANPTEISFQKEGLSTHLLIATAGGNVHHLKEISKPIAQIETSNEGRFGVLSNTFAFAVTRSSPVWYGFAVDYVSNKVSRIKFQGDCQPGVAVNDSDQNAPQGVSYKSPGNYAVELTAYSSTAEDVDQQQITIQNIEAPVISISHDNVCVNSQVTFQAADNSGLSLSSYSWDFGDGNTSILSTPVNQFITTGTFSITLSATASNTCANSAKKDVQIFNPPAASFLLPVGAPLCTNQNLIFTNTSGSDTGSAPSWQWFVNSIPSSNSTDLNFAFTNAVNQTVKLRASIPGCFTENTQIVGALLAGPNIDFNIVGKCQDETIQFENLTTDQVNSFSWDFGDTQSSAQVSPNHSYPAIGIYSISLAGDSPNGCLNSKVKTLTIYSKPQPDFSLDLPPFSCAGSLSQFNNLTPAPTDSNLATWNWSFGDAANGTSANKNPSYEYSIAGSYNVSLVSTTNFGCTATKLKAVQIAETPDPDFTIGPSCPNQPTYFADASGTDNKSWLWKIGSSSYTLQNPAHVFSDPGNFTAQLTVTGNNGCLAVLSKSITVPVPPVLDFSIQNNCAGLVTMFTDDTPLSADPIVSRVWDFAGKGSGDGVTPQFSFSAAGSYNVKMTTIGQSGCSYSLAKNVSIVPSPIADFLTSIESGPPPLNIQFTNTSLHATSFTWQFNDGANSASVEQSPVFTYTSLGDFIVDLNASNAEGCMDTKSKIIHVIIPHTEIELEEFKLLTDASNGSVRPVLTIKNNGNYTVNEVDVTLNVSGKALISEKIGTAILPNTSFTQILNYELSAGESSLDYLCVELSLSGDSNLQDNSACISLDFKETFFPPYPNPASGNVHLDWIATVPSATRIFVVNQIGQIAYENELNEMLIGLNQTVLDLSKLNSGLYIIVFERAGNRKALPIIIQN